jgi:hypothetical protein
MAFLRAVTAFCAVLAILCSRSTLAQDNLLERGRYLVETVGFCGVCHNSRGPNGQMIPGMELAGGRVMSMNEMRTVLSNIPPGDIRAVVPNITPDPETGIGRWTDVQIATAIRGGPRPNGTFIGPPMPIALYRGIRMTIWRRSSPTCAPSRQNTTQSPNTHHTPFRLSRWDYLSNTSQTLPITRSHGARISPDRWRTA